MPQKKPSPKKLKAKRKFKMPNAYVIVFLALLITIVLSYFIPVSVHDPKTEEVIYNATFNDKGAIIKGTGPQPMGLWNLLVAPIQGFQSASDVGVALLIAGGFLNVLNVTGALEAGIGKMLGKFKGNTLIALMMLVFAIMGTVFGFWEEITAFAIVVIPLFVLAGYDVITGLGVLFVGASIGNMASVVNPFSTGAAVSAISNKELTLGSGILLRAVLFAALYVVGTLLVIRYANRVKSDPSKSILANVQGVKTGTEQHKALPEMTTRRAWSIGVFILIVIVLLVGYVPWQAIGGERLYRAVNAPLRFLGGVPVLGNLLGAKYITPLGDWGFTEFSFLFFFGAFLLKFINCIKVNDFVSQFIDGATDLLGVVLVLAISRGIAIVMGDSAQGMSVTFVYWISNAIASVPLWIFAVVAVLAFIGIGLFLQSTSGVAGISMPILGAVAAAIFRSSPVGVIGGQIVLISAFTVGLNFMTSIYPEAVVMGTIELFNVPYDRYLKFMLRIMIVLLLIGVLIITAAPYIRLAF